jgi:sugar phosphate isomerase/epimerase
MNRRQFLASSISVVAGATLAARADDALPFAIGVQSYTFRQFKLEQALQRMQKLGLKNAEFYNAHVPPTSTPSQVETVLKLCKEYEVKPRAFGVHGFSKDHDKNKRAFDFGKNLGIEVFSADPDPDSFDSLDKLCEEYKIAIAIHPHGPMPGNKMHRWYSADVIMKGVKDHHPLIGACLDTGHLIRSAQMGHKLDPAEEVRKMGNRNFGMHLKDHDNATKTDVVFGQGVLNVAAIFKALKEVNFKHMVSIEYEANPADPSADVQACLEVVKQVAKS